MPKDLIEVLSDIIAKAKEEEDVDPKSFLGDLEKAIKAVVAEETKPLKAKKEEFQTKYKELKDQLESVLTAVGAGDAEQLTERIQDLEEMERKHAEEAGDLRTQLDIERKKWERETEAEKKKLVKQVEELKEQLESEKRFVHRMTVDQVLDKRLREAGVPDHLRPGAIALIERNHKPFVKEEGEDRLPVVEDSDGIVMDLETFVESWAEGDTGKHYVEAPSTHGGGGGERPPKGKGSKIDGNPFDRESKAFSLKEQARLQKENPSEFERLQKEAKELKKERARERAAQAGGHATAFPPVGVRVR